MKLVPFFPSLIICHQRAQHLLTTAAAFTSTTTTATTATITTTASAATATTATATTATATTLLQYHYNQFVVRR